MTLCFYFTHKLWEVCRRALNGEREERMNKIDWTRKLTSRKFWLSIASFVAMLLVAFGQTEATATQITSIIMAGATVIGYVIGEGLADSGHSGGDDSSDKDEDL